jgi:hypothetical protein
VRRVFSFPNQVNETSARLVASGVVLQCVAFLIFRQWWQLIPLTYGFVARVLTGPTLSPLGQFVTRWLTPRIGRRMGGSPRLVPGPPKRFAQGIGATCTIAASCALALSHDDVAFALVATIAVAATLESVFSYCLGCVIFSKLMRWGVIPSDVCEACNDITERLVAARA